MKAEAWAILPAGGTGSRFSRENNKLLVLLGGHPILAWTVQALLAATRVKGLMMVAHPDHQPEYQAVISGWDFPKPVLWAEGGPTRRDSVYNGLMALPDTANIAVIHDAARPLISATLVDEAIYRVEKGSIGVVVGVPLQDTVKQVYLHGQQRPLIDKTIDRTTLWRAQTPQVFRKNLILKAHQSVPPSTPVTDDAQLMELSGYPPVEMMRGEERNLKITTPDDLRIAEALLREPAGLI